MSHDGSIRHEPVEAAHRELPEAQTDLMRPEHGSGVACAAR